MSRAGHVDQGEPQHPARVVEGFTTGAYDTRTTSYIVDDRDAHAWVEAWLPSGSTCQPTEYESPSDSRIPLTCLGFCAASGCSACELLRHDDKMAITR